MSFSKAAEELLMQAVRKVASYAEGEGFSPTDAVVKAASELRVPREYVPLMAQAYNQGRATMQRVSCGDDMLCKIAEFPLASAADAMQQLYPSVLGNTEKDAVSAEYAAPPRKRSRPQDFAISFKSAAAPERDARSQMVRDYSKQQAEKRAYEEARRVAGVASRQFTAKLAETIDYFKQPAQSRLAFAEVESNAIALFGKLAAHVLDYAYAMAGLKEKRASTQTPVVKAARDQTPYVQIEQTLATARDAVAKEQQFARIKQASIYQYALGSGMGRGLEDMLAKGLTRKDPDVMLQKAVLQLEDPAHMNALRQIEAKAMLADMLRNDETISGYQPDEVLEAYNEISALSPRAATHAAVMRPLLRKRLAAGAVEPFEGQQLLDIEKGIRQSTAAPSSYLIGNYNDDAGKSPIFGG
jgi:hypothetical protein